MSTPFDTTASVPLVRPGRRVADGHQSGSWTMPAAAMLRLWRVWIDRVRQREALVDLAQNEHLLKDIGLTRDEALDEVNKPFWK
jgi:uncharacterized protein YjiS (DUF1127 family)